MPSTPAAIAFAPKSDGLLAASADGEILRWDVHCPYPEVSLRALFGKVWYEGYERPAYVWQSTGGSDAFEPKLSLWPLIFGSIFIAFVMFAPEGIWGILTSRFKTVSKPPDSSGGKEASDAAA